MPVSPQRVGPQNVPEHAARVAVPAASAVELRELAEHEAYVREREVVERRRHVRALLMLALVVLALSMVRAGLDRVFPQRWWHPW